VYSRKAWGCMSDIPLSNGYVAKVDDADCEWLSQFSWFGHLKPSGVVYAIRGLTVNGKRTTRKMHRDILGLEVGEGQVDHINGDGLDNRRSNLRMASIGQNASSKKRRRDNTSGFKGVSRNGSRWRAVVNTGGKRTHLGYFDSPEDAYAAYCAAAKELHGEFARFQ
jgi:hypothetical protein